MRILALALLLSSAACAAAADEPSYFIFGSSPAAVKYVSGRLLRLPVQDEDDVGKLEALEAISALVRAPRLGALSASAQPRFARISPPHVPGYGVPMFDVVIESSVAQKAPPRPLLWSGPAPFREILFDSHSVDTRLRSRLIRESRRALAPQLDFRHDGLLKRRLQVEGPVSVRDYGRVAVAPHLAFVDINWRVKDLPEVLANHGIDSWSPFFRVEYVIDTRTGRTLFRNISNTGPAEDRDMRLFKEPGGPLLMAISIACTDGSEPLILDLERESYGTGRRGDVPDNMHCFPGQ